MHRAHRWHGGLLSARRQSHYRASRRLDAPAKYYLLLGDDDDDEKREREGGERERKREREREKGREMTKIEGRREGEKEVVEGRRKKDRCLSTVTEERHVLSRCRADADAHTAIHRARYPRIGFQEDGLYEGAIRDILYYTRGKERERERRGGRDRRFTR